MRLRTLSAVAPVLCLLAAFALQPSAHAVGPKGDLFLGYSRTGNDTFYPSTGGLNGWDAAGQLRLHPFLGAEVDIAHYGLGADSTVPRTTTYLFGPRVTVGAARVHVFGHAIFGGEHSASPDGSISGNAFAFALGGGLDLPLAPFFAWRFAGDYLKAPTQFPSDGTPARFGTGLVFRF
jgi:hypothetical protein